MSLIENHRSERMRMAPMMDRNRHKEDEDSSVNAVILDLGVLKSYVNKVVEHWTTDRKDVSEHRKFTKIWEVDLQNVLGYVDEPTWVFMIESYIEWCKDTMKAVQANGQWEVYAHEFKMERKIHRQNQAVGRKKDNRPDTVEVKTPIDKLVIGVQFVDVLGETNMQYEMGRPTTDKSKLDPKLLQALIANAPKDTGLNDLVKNQEGRITAQTKQLDDQSEIISQLRKDQAASRLEQKKTNDLMMGLLSQLKELQGSDEPKKVVRRQKK